MVLVKTPAGQEALKDRHGSLSSRQRSAFILFDGKRTTGEILAATAAMGITQDDVQAMIAQGLLAPVGTPAAVITRLNTELNAVLNDAAVREKLRVMGIEPTPGTAEQYRDEIKRDLDRYGAVVKAAGISIE